MQMKKYLETYEIKDIKNYCQNRCIKIVNENLNNKVLRRIHLATQTHKHLAS